MNNSPDSFGFVLPTEIRYGENAASGLPAELNRRHIGSVLLVSDPAIMSRDFATKIIRDLEQEGIKVRTFDRVEPNPKDQNVEEAAALAREIKADALVALGGGSPIDCAKAAAIVATHRGKVRDFEDRSRINGSPLPLFTIPTTAGTGSEVTFSSVITDTREDFKFTVKSPLVAPQIAFIDPLLTHSMPAGLTAATGMDALTHAVEAYTAKVANPLSDAAALYAVELINTHLEKAVVEPANREARAGMMTGSLLAGIAFSHSDVAAVHCLAEALGGKYDTPHGVCNAVVLPVMMEYNLDFAVEKYARIARAMDLEFNKPEEGARLAVERTKELARKVGLPDFTSFGVQEKDFRELADNSTRNGSNADNPRPMSSDDYMEVLKILSKKYKTR